MRTASHAPPRQSQNQSHKRPRTQRPQSIHANVQQVAVSPQSSPHHEAQHSDQYEIFAVSSPRIFISTVPARASALRDPRSPPCSGNKGRRFSGQPFLRLPHIINLHEPTSTRIQRVTKSSASRPVLRHLPGSRHLLPPMQRALHPRHLYIFAHPSY